MLLLLLLLLACILVVLFVSSRFVYLFVFVQLWKLSDPDIDHKWGLFFTSCLIVTRSLDKLLFFNTFRCFVLLWKSYTVDNAVT